MGTPIAYLRRSRVEAGRPGAVSHEEQERAVRALAAQHGYTLRDEDIVEDWGRSGGEGKEDKRPAYLALKARIEAGDVTDVFAYNLARLTRSGIEWAALAVACRDHGVRVHFSDQSFDFRGISGRLTADILAAVARAERERAQEAGLVTINHRRARGDALGAPRYGSADGEDPSVVIAAFREAGSFQGAARLLTERGVRPKSAGLTPVGITPATATPRPYQRDPDAKAPAWRASTVRAIIRREAPGLIPRNTRRGSRSVGVYRFASLLRCACGGLLTGQGRKNGVVIYRCSASQTDPTHSSPKSVSESRILPWMKREVARLETPPEIAGDPVDPARRAEITDRMTRVTEMYMEGRIDRERYDQEAAAYEAAVGELDDAAAYTAVPPFDWDWPVEEINRGLRLLFLDVKLGPDMSPAAAEWRVPRFRAE